MSGRVDPRLSDADVAEIRHRKAAGESQRVLAREFRVERRTIRSICRRDDRGAGRS